METKSVDVAVIGAGTAGLNARREVEKAGASFVLIESGPYGTTCARVGCMPSKLIIAAANAAQGVRVAETFGVHPGSCHVDGPAVMERIRAERDRFTGAVVEATEQIPEAFRLAGRARFVDTTTLEVGGHTRVRARAVVIATGSRPTVPPPFDALPDRVDVNDDLFEWPDLPRSVAVVGTGIMGLELGQALHRLGVQVAFFNPFDQVGPFTDPALQREARETFRRELELHVGIRDVMAERADGGVRIRWIEAGERHDRMFDRVLVAAGRRPNLAGLGLERTGLELDERGMPPWDPRTCQCGEAPIFLAGDASGHRQLLHEASDEGHIAGANATRYPEVTAHVRRTSLTIAFTEPQIGLVGTTYRALGEGVAIGQFSYANQGRARVLAINEGLVRLYADRRSCALIGAEMFGHGVEHMAHLLAWAIQGRFTVQDALSMPFYHPVLEEGLRSALRDLANELRIAGACRGEDMPDTPGS